MEFCPGGLSKFSSVLKANLHTVSHPTGSGAQAANHLLREDVSLVLINNNDLQINQGV